MQSKTCFPERFSKLLLSALMFCGGVGFAIIGFTVLPVVGFLFAIPMLVLAGYFYRVHLNERCRIE